MVSARAVTILRRAGVLAAALLAASGLLGDARAQSRSVAGADALGAPASALDSSASGLPAWVTSVRVVRGDEPLRTAPDGGASRRGAARIGAQLPAYAAQRGPGCAGHWIQVGPQGWICSEGVELSTAPPLPADFDLPSSEDGLLYRYSFVNELGALGYRELATAEEGAPDVELEPGFAVALARTADRRGEPFGLTPHGYWVPLRDLRPARPSFFRGALLTEGTPSDLAWTIRENTPVAQKPGGPAARRLPTRHERLVVQEERRLNGRTWLRIGPEEWVAAQHVARVLPADPPSDLRPDERWIDVDLGQQVLTAFEGSRPVFATLVSTGKGRGDAENATPLGEHRIWVKLVASDMSNLEAAEANRYYSMQSVPWVMYFKKGYGLHGAYWHNDFGQRRSHGCVNLSPLDAAWLFRWTEPRLPAGWTAILPGRYERGTLIRVRDSGR